MASNVKHHVLIVGSSSELSHQDKIEFFDGDILDSPETYICHQCNCVTSEAAGLAKSLFGRYKYANSYIHRGSADKYDNHFDKPGTISIMHNEFPDQPNIVNMYAQYFPGRCHLKKASDTFETYDKRLKWFEQCLNELGRRIEEDVTIAFPYGIGCGLAGGHWGDYYNLIRQFVNQFGHKIKYVRIYKKE